MNDPLFDAVASTLGKALDERDARIAELEAQLREAEQSLAERDATIAQLTKATPPAEGGAEIGNTSGISGANSQGSVGDPPRDTDAERIAGKKVRS